MNYVKSAVKVQPTNLERWGAGMVICLRGAGDLHVVQQMPLPPPSIISCFVTQVILRKRLLNDVVVNGCC